jgi:hypothetical protein
LTLPKPQLTTMHGVLGLRDIVLQDPSRDEEFIAAVRSEFPNVINRVVLPQEARPDAPHLVVASTSSQLVLSRVQADFEVRFYGDYLDDIDKALQYVERKLGVVLAGFEAIGACVAMIGLIGTVRFSFNGREDRPVEHILKTHLRSTVDPPDVQDAVARVAVRLRDTYFVNLTVSNYETRALERPLLPGQPMVVRGWEGRVDDVGLELAVDINNNLEARVNQKVPDVTRDGLRAVTALLRDIVTDSGPAFVDTGEISTARLTESSMA